MKSYKLGLHEVKFYNSIDDLPIKRFQKFNKYMMIDNEVGSTFEDFLRRDRMISEFIDKEMYEEAKTAMSNRSQTVFNAYMDYSPREQALAIMVHSIDGKRYTDYSDDTLDEITGRLDEYGFTKKDMDETIEKVKKKSKKNWFNTFLRRLLNLRATGS